MRKKFPKRSNIIDSDVAQANTDYYLLCHIARLVNEGFFYDGGKIRGVPVKISGSKYIPPIPIESIVKERKRLTNKDNTFIIVPKLI